MYQVDIEPVKKQLLKIPSQLRTKLLVWVRGVEEVGIERMRLIPGFHDEPLQGKRWGQRSIRLNKSYRAIYTENRQSNYVLIRIEEVNKHDY